MSTAQLLQLGDGGKSLAGSARGWAGMHPVQLGSSPSTQLLISLSLCCPETSPGLKSPQSPAWAARAAQFPPGMPQERGPGCSKPNPGALTPTTLLQATSGQEMPPTHCSLRPQPCMRYGLFSLGAMQGCPPWPSGSGCLHPWPLSSCSLPASPQPPAAPAWLSRAQCLSRGGQLLGTSCHYVPDVTLLSFLLFGGTFLCCTALKHFKSSRYFPTGVSSPAVFLGCTDGSPHCGCFGDGPRPALVKASLSAVLQLRKLVSDFSIILAILIFCAIDVALGLETPKLLVPSELKVTGGWGIGSALQEVHAGQGLWALPGLLGTQRSPGTAGWGKTPGQGAAAACARSQPGGGRICRRMEPLLRLACSRPAQARPTHTAGAGGLALAGRSLLAHLHSSSTVSSIVSQIEGALEERGGRGLPRRAGIPPL